MAYTSENFKSKAALKRAVAAGDAVGIFNPGLGTAPTDGFANVEGPWYPKPHTWYARVLMKDSYVAKVVS